MIYEYTVPHQMPASHCDGTAPRSDPLRPLPHPPPSISGMDSDTHSLWGPRLLTTNDAPSALEIATVQEEATTLQNQIHDLQTRLRECRAILSPLRRVPAEVLALIFIFAVDVPPDHYTDKRQLLKLCLVCKAWYRAAVGTQHLWGLFDIVLFGESSPNWTILDTWVRRANQASRSLKVSQGEGCRHVFQHTVQCVMRNRALTKFLVEGPPLHSLVLEVSNSDCFENLVGSIQAWHSNSKTPPNSGAMAWNSLAHLELRFVGKYLGAWQAPCTASQSFLSHLPTSLSSLGLHVPDEKHVERMESDSWQTDPPWTSLHIRLTTLQSLTNLSIACNWNDAYLILTLEHCTNIRVLSIDFRNANTWWTENMESPGYELPRRLWEAGITLPKLHTLHIIGMRRSSVEYYLPFLCLPALLNLRIGLSSRRFYVDDTHPDYDLLEEAGFAISSFIRTLRDRCSGWKETLRSLAVEIPQGSRIESINAQQLISVISDFPSLAHLSLDHFSFELEPFIDASPRLYFPSLEHLELQNIPGDFDLAGLLECLEHWRRNGELDNLTRVSVSYAKHGHTDETDKERMKTVERLKVLGMAIEGDVEVENKPLYFWSSLCRWA